MLPLVCVLVKGKDDVQVVREQGVTVQFNRSRNGSSIHNY